ncbi:MAG TPA: hypothetical protein VN088_13345, partial [Nocardioides sp.]|nr:hypothetical protein [Nocardioides sp.]
RSAAPGGQDVPTDAGALASMAQSLANQASPPTSATPTGLDAGSTTGGDVSWPQCSPGMGIPQKRSSGQPMPLPDASFVIVGLTNGPGFVRNPCLKSQVQWVKIHRLDLAAYSVVTYPSAADLHKYRADGPYDASTDLGQLRNVGYQQATYNVGSMGLAGLATPIVWLDIENVPDFDWPQDNAQKNAAVVQGAAKGYRDAGYQVGVYGTPTIWAGIVGGLTLGADVPEWRAAGQTSSTEAVNRCGADWSIQGGPAVLGQWVEQRRDRDVVCPGVAADLSTWFHQT